MFVCYRQTWLPCSLAPHMTQTLNQHDPGSALIRNSLPLTVCCEVPLFTQVMKQIYIVNNRK